ncbi:MAG TPA: DMT family transporter [Caldilineaceae bacterium]|nr:DMT family transporter [Caldilineaceae bacterium]
MQATQAPAARYSGLEVSLFGLLLLVDSLHFVFARALLPYFDSIVAATLVLGVATVQLGLYALLRGRLSWQAIRGHWLFYLAIGVLVGGSTALGYTAVGYIDTGTAAMLGKLSTLFSMVFGLVWLREQLNWVQVGGGLLAVAGVLVITFQPGALLRFGSLLVVGSTLMYALHAALVKRYGQEIDFMHFFFGRLLFTTAALLVFAVGRPLIAWPPAPVWLLVVAAGTVDVVISRSLYYLALRRLPMTIHAIVLTLSPVATILWALVLFDTFPQPQQLAGGVAVLMGVLLATFYRTR